MHIPQDAQKSAALKNNMQQNSRKHSMMLHIRS